MANAFSYKITNESELFTFDYSPVLNSGETITTASCFVEVISGTDPNQNAILVGSPFINGSLVSQRVSNGVSEVTYRLSMTAVTNQTNVYTVVGDLPVYSTSLV
jgi:hypothetical protein